MESGSAALKRKRRPAGESPNPLFLKWVEEWRDEAREEGSKVQYAYAKALNSLRKYPLPLTSGQEAKILDHIGEKLAKKLDKKLAEHRAAEGENNYSCVKKSKVAAMGDVQTCSTQTGASVKGNRKRAAADYDYVPEYRSGPYALVIALYRAQEKPSWIGHLTKPQLISQAQPLSDKSFTIPDDGKYYTAWSSMATLIRKGLVDKRSCPAKFKLTEAGEEMAERLERATFSLASSTNSLSPTHSPSSSSEASCRPSPTERRSAELPSPASFGAGDPRASTRFATQSLPEKEGPSICLVSDSDDGSSDVEVVPCLSDRLNSNKHASSSHSSSAVNYSASSQLKHSESGGRVCVKKMPVRGERDGDEKSNSASERSGSLTPAVMAGQAALHRLKAAGNGAGSGRGSKEHRSPKSRKADPIPGKDSSSVAAKRRWLQSDEEDEFPDFSILARKKPSPTHRSPSEHRSPTSHSPTTSSSEITSTAQNFVSSPPTSPDSLGPPLFSLRPGEFEVVLCVDSAESTASRKSNSQFRGILLQELAKNGVRFDVRKLNVGDFLWIAREKSSPLPGQLTLPRSREVVLEYIVERKRMDDLAGSITDGRFNEQKFRLRQCGVRCPMYLVEEFRDKMHLKLPLRSLEQAISNTQVIDGFSVHRTTDIRDSVAYLTLLTRQLSTHYSGKRVQAYTWDAIAQLNQPPMEGGSATPERGPSNYGADGNAVRGMEFESFNESSIKNKSLSAYEMFGRHLIQIPSVSAERAAAILDHFPTIASLREAYGRCEDSREREVLISSLKAGQSRGLGKSIGKIMCSLYWEQ